MKNATKEQVRADGLSSGGWRLSSWLLAVMALLAAMTRGLPEAATPRISPPPSATPKPAPMSDDFLKKWQALIAAAKVEGELVVAHEEPEYDWVLRVFEKKFGIKVVVSRGRARQQTDRILAERRAGRYTMDIGHLGGPTVNERYLPAKALQPIPPLLIHPDVTDLSRWWSGKHFYSDLKDQFNFIHSAQTNPISIPAWYNTKLVSEKDIRAIKTPWDFLTDRWKGVLTSIGPPTGSTWVDMYLSPEFGPQWARTFIQEMDIFFTNDSAVMSNGIAHGRFHAVFPSGRLPNRNEMLQLISFGMPIAENNIPVAGVRLRLSGGASSNSITVFDRPPHPNAAKLYLNWLLTREGQTIKDSAVGAIPHPSLRMDVPPGTTEPQARKVPGVSYVLFNVEPEYKANYIKGAEALVELYNSRRAMRR